MTDLGAVCDRPRGGSSADATSGEPAWESVTSWYLVTTENNVIPAATRHFMAERAGATTVEVPVGRLGERALRFGW